jgi:hypothetical protein
LKATLTQLPHPRLQKFLGRQLHRRARELGFEVKKIEEPPVAKEAGPAEEVK